MAVCTLTIYASVIGAVLLRGASGHADPSLLW